MPCDRTAQLHAYHDGELPPVEAHAVESHVANCPECAALLADLRGLSSFISNASRAEMPDRLISRFHGQWYAAQERGTLRVLSWLTGAAAALLVGGLVMYANVKPAAPVARATSWEAVALTPSPLQVDSHANEQTAELVQVAQWIADDLSLAGGEGR